MIRTIVGSVGLVLAVGVHAGTSGSSAVVPQPGGIITPDVATSVYVTENFATTSEGILVVCPRWARLRGNECTTDKGSAWVHASGIIPGKQYVGFRLSNGYYGKRLLEVYFK